MERSPLAKGGKKVIAQYKIKTHYLKALPRES